MLSVSKFSQLRFSKFQVCDRVCVCVLQNWEVNYQHDTPVAPRFDVNAPDLYIPAMGFITYVLVAGLALGTQNRYT